jgi:hypothetical protein
MKLLLTLVFTITIFLASGQSVTLKKKYLKTYVGEIPAYEVNLNNQLIPVNASTIEVRLTKDSVFVNVGSVKWEGTYSTSKIEKKKFELNGTMNETGIPERLLLDTKAKKLTRRGLFPQPDVILERKK